MCEAMIIEYKHTNIYQLDGRAILTDVNFEVGDGEFVYIIGRVGSGKSSLLTLKRKHVPSLRRQMGIVFQDFQLLSDRSVWKNLYFVLNATGWKKKAIAQRIDEVLADVGMTEKKGCMPYELSGGEQQRIAIARAILNTPKLIVADEPTANLDSETADGIMDLLRSISEKGTAVVMSTHNLSLLDNYPGTVYKCQDGKIEKQEN